MKSLYGKIGIIHEPSASEPFVVLSKPKGLPSAPLKENDVCALNYAAEKFPCIRKICGRKPIELGLVHRIDNETEGLLLVATTQNFYDELLEIQKSGNFIKTYSAVCRSSDENSFDSGFPQLEEELAGKIQEIKNHSCNIPFSSCVSSFFRPYGIKNKMVRPVTADSGRAALKKATGKKYSTKFTVLDASDSERVLIECAISEGYRHQVRCHLAWLGFPISGDPLYDSLRNEGDFFDFKACGIKFLDFEFRI